MKDFPTKILAATDGSGGATLAVEAAVDVAARGGSDLHLVHTWQAIPSARFGSYIRQELRREAWELLDGQAAQVEDASGIACTPHLREGRAAEEIVDLAQEIGAGLVVVGSRGLGAAGRFFLGSVSEEVVRAAPCPILIIGDEKGSWPPRRVVFADDGSEEAREAADLAARIGELFGARGILVRAYAELPEADEEARAYDPRLADDEMRRTQDILSERAGGLTVALGTQPKVRLAENDAANAILGVAREGGAGRTLLSVGSRGLRTVQRMRIGSVSDRVKAGASGPVLVCPPRGPVG